MISATVVARYPARVSGLANFMQWLFPRMEPAVASSTSGQVHKGNDLGSLIAVMRTLPEPTIADQDGNVMRIGSDPKPNQPFGPWLDMEGREWEMNAAGNWTLGER